jgi:hypothetical protein
MDLIEYEYITTGAQVGAAMAAIVALFLPMFHRAGERKRKLELLQRELARNMSLLGEIAALPPVIPSGNESQTVLSADSTMRYLLEAVTLRNWDRFKYEIATAPYVCMERHCDHIHSVLIYWNTHFDYHYTRHSCESTVEAYDHDARVCKFLPTRKMN